MTTKATSSSVPSQVEVTAVLCNDYDLCEHKFYLFAGNYQHLDHTTINCDYDPDDVVTRQKIEQQQYELNGLLTGNNPLVRKVDREQWVAAVVAGALVIEVEIYDAC